MANTLRVLIWGSRDLDEREPAAGPVWVVLDGLAHQVRYDLEVVEGGASGADALARAWLADDSQLGGPIGRTFPAEWSLCVADCQPGHRKQGRNGQGDYCPAAGFRRNEQMARYLAAHDGPTAAWGFVNRQLRDSHGSHDMAMRLWRHRVPFQVVQVVTPPGTVRNVSEAFQSYAGVL